ncbi:carbon-nitrogen hydrolase [Triangularia setosa]|uniref:Carbon-nitrogen hydrolase n=1 Tax=Triangularia setosa TaxID=2587417 RepID=A0AAN7A1Q7_9PEZI|nr:carbon-nitrogen hydrolase [Podospora setosa]
MASNTPQTKFKVAAVHASPVFMNKSATLAKVVDLIEQAAKEEIKFLAFPETFVPGYPYFIECYPPITQAAALAKYAEESVVVSQDLGAVAQICREKRIGISLGVSERMEDGYTLFNSQVMIDSNGEVVSVHRKLQPTYVERMVWAQGGGATLDVKPLEAIGGFNVGGLACWENTMNGARQALISQNQHIHCAAWPALNTMSGFESTANSQIEALAKTHALTAQVFVLVASNYVDQTCLDWMASNLGEQNYVKLGGGWSGVVHPFCSILSGPVEGGGEKEKGDQLVSAEINLADLKVVKVWIDSNGHYARPEVVRFGFDKRPLWGDEKRGEGHHNANAQKKCPLLRYPKLYTSQNIKKKKDRGYHGIISVSVSSFAHFALCLETSS